MFLPAYLGLRENNNSIGHCEEMGDSFRASYIWIETSPLPLSVYGTHSSTSLSVFPHLPRESGNGDFAGSI